ncbi:hypothetical protein L9F63_014065 [Diploptera punctata]|uniref:Ionotropic glutamate receptor C-terminal domain-containing protein n=1 Tax=Diploptera punctata TaxID=6984 RepID=A0AAD8A8P2_DIPPU|nr:hypothetical protein L9F63_014065 [Diploptera punctata]
MDFTLVYSDCSVPYMRESVRLQIPCPNPIPKVKRVISIFTVPSWFMLGFVYLIVSLTMWIISNIMKTWNFEPDCFRKVADSLYNSWAILLGVSVTELPTSPYVRFLFIIYVSYCFAMTTVFGAFFTTFLIEPGYDRGFKSYEEMNNQGIEYGSLDLVDQIIQISDNEEHLRMKSKIDCSYITGCVERAMFEKNLAVLTGSNFPYFLALKHGVTDVNRVVCFLDTVFDVYVPIAMHVGNPLLPLLDRHIRQCVEAGVGEKFWSEVKHLLQLEAKRKYSENEMYFVFGLNHLGPVFILLLCGYSLSILVFVLEIIVGKFIFLSVTISKIFFLTTGKCIFFLYTRFTYGDLFYKLSFVYDFD